MQRLLLVSIGILSIGGSAWAFTPERQTVILSAPMSAYTAPPSGIVAATEEGWHITRVDDRIVSMERSRIRLP